MELQQKQQHSPTLDDCLKLLKGDRDEQRLAGLLLVTKFCEVDDVASLRRVYDAVGVTFLDRLLRTGMSKESGSGNGANNRDAYLQLSVTVLAAFCRVPEIASSEDMVSKIPLILELVSTSSGAVLEECCELLYQVAASSEDGAKSFHESGGIKVLAYQMSSLPDGSRIIELAMKILQSVLNKLSLDSIINSYLQELSMMLVSIGRQFAVLHNQLKFDTSPNLHEWGLIGDNTCIKVINGIEESVNVVLEYLQDAKEHGQKKGDDLLASVRLVGSYLAETPHACKDKSFSLCMFLLPVLCQITMNTEGCKALVSSGSYQAVFRYLIKVVGPSRCTGDDNSSIFLACDTVMNLLLKKEQALFSVDEETVVDLLIALGYWAENTDDASDIMMASSICALLFDSTSEEALLNHPNFSINSLGSLSQLMARSFAFPKQETSDAVTGEMDLIEIVTSEPVSTCSRRSAGNLIAPAEKLHALILAESMMSLFGENWLIGQSNLPDLQESLPRDKCLLLVLEYSRVEVAVLLNELAYLKYEASKNTSAYAETIILKQQKVAIAFSLIERIIKLISSIAESEGGLIDDNTCIKVISGIEESVNVVLEYLQDAKEHGQKKEDDLLASVRLVGSYLAETPDACKDKVRELLGYMLSIEADDEPSPFLSVCFLLPVLCQLTMNTEGCKALISSGSYQAVFRYLIKVVGPSRCTVDDNSSIFLACDTVMNLLLKKEQALFSVDEATVVDLLIALGYWSENTDDASDIMMASSICALLFDSTSEEALLNHPSFSISSLGSLSQLMARCFAFSQKEKSDAVTGEMDLIEIVTSGFSRWANRFPRVRAAVQGI
ncbi:uncharacterized protein [Euphorbia lathyris]|uniref:uncharacterized protein n=1 Tax=Euphorbia lathyris TaxID=212925 RepID=UPI00331353BC